ncbi:unnamed protein product [Hydatigera taeniaeformis]|uniref:GP-PDE domain-containing protein n=1 Tax=Hydatigena taeniaeformis TaxID=6205 RepID=A0A0R3WVK4_HYDTA|nr:unnamed protein product [Hydatigera taeniaeformis]
MEEGPLPHTYAPYDSLHGPDVVKYTAFDIRLLQVEAATFIVPNRLFEVQTTLFQHCNAAATDVGHFAASLSKALHMD